VKRGIAMRIAKLERRLGKGRGEFYVVALPDGMDGDDALAALGLAPGPDDLVVFTWQSSGKTQPELRNRCPLVR
jgi:hypothetical protein